MSKLILVVAVMALMAPSTALAATPDWVHEYGTRCEDSVSSVAVSGNLVFAAGTQRDCVDGESYKDDLGDVRAFALNGTPAWVSEFGSNLDQDFVRGLAATPVGEYVVGQQFTHPIVKFYDPSGNEVWTRLTQWSPWAVASSGNDAFAFGGKRQLHLQEYTPTGSVGWSAKFGRWGNFRVAVAASSQQVVAEWPGRSDGDPDFLRAYDLSGGLLWSARTRVPGNEFVTGISVSGDRTYLAGSTIRSAAPPPAQHARVFLQALGPHGGVLWTRRFGNWHTQAFDVSASGDDIVVVGRTKGAIGGDPHLGGYDAFAETFDGAGNEVSTTQFGTIRYDAATAVAQGTSGTVFVGGDTSGTFPGETYQGDCGGLCPDDAFVARLPVT